MIEKKGDGDRRYVQWPFLCVSWVRGLNHGTQLSIPGCSPCPWYQPTDCLNQGIPSILPDIVVFPSTHKCAHPILAPLHIVLLLLQGQVEVSYNLGCGTPFPYKGLGGQRETCHVSSIVLGSSADSLWAIRLSG